VDPLRKFPGPKFAAFSRIPLTWTTLRGEGLRWIQTLHDKHGPTVRVAPDEHSFIQAQAWKVYAPNSYAKYGLDRDQEFFACFFDSRLTGASILSASEDLKLLEDEEHRPWAHALPLYARDLRSLLHFLTFLYLNFSSKASYW